MTVSSPNVIEIKFDRLIDDMRLLRSQMIAFDKRLKGIALRNLPTLRNLTRADDHSWVTNL
jgi:hypothetical protein